MIEVGARLPNLADPATGYPRTWRGFVYGLRIIGQLDARATLRAASAAAIASTPDKDARAGWFAAQNRAAGW
jgi:hypothetical protein